MYVSCKEKYPEHNVDLYTTFTDLTKAFYTVSWEDLWKIMTKFGCPEHFIKMVRQLHDGMQAQVLENSDSSTLFSVTSGVKQGYVMLPTLFSMMFAAMLTDAFQDSDPGRGIRYRTERKLFNLRCLRDKTKVHVDRLRDFLFTGRRLVDDWSTTGPSMLLALKTCSAPWTCPPLRGTTLVGTKKTEVMYQPAPGKTYQQRAKAPFQHKKTKKRILPFITQ